MLGGLNFIRRAASAVVLLANAWGKRSREAWKALSTRLFFFKNTSYFLLLKQPAQHSKEIP